MNAYEVEILRFVAGIGLLVIGAVLKAAFDRVAIERGWVREDRKATDGKIERIDSLARAEIARIERELGGRLGELEGSVGILSERVANLPTADDLQDVERRLASVDRSLSGVVSRVDGMAVNVKTILDHILASERRG